MGGGIKGGGAGGGGGMLRTIHRAVQAGVGGGQPEPFSANNDTQRNTKQSNKKNESPVTLSSRNNNSNASSTFSSLVNLPVSALGSCSSPNWNDESEWECLDSSEDEKGYVLNDDFVFGTVPSRDEVQHAVSALQQVFSPTSFSSLRKEKVANDLGINEAKSQVGYISSVEPELDWVEPSMHFFNSKRLQPHHGANRVYDAFHLLQTDSTVQKMVVSLSSDKAVWDAVLNNEVVQELRGSLNQELPDSNKKVTSPETESPHNPNPAKDVLSWILTNTKVKIVQLIEKITGLVNELFDPRDKEKSSDTADPWEEMLKTSFFLSMMVLLVVVVSRAHSP